MNRTGARANNRTFRWSQQHDHESHAPFLITVTDGDASDLRFACRTDRGSCSKRGACSCCYLHVRFSRRKSSSDAECRSSGCGGATRLEPNGCLALRASARGLEARAPQRSRPVRGQAGARSVERWGWVGGSRSGDGGGERERESRAGRQAIARQASHLQVMQVIGTFRRRQEGGTCPALRR